MLRDGSTLCEPPHQPYLPRQPREGQSLVHSRYGVISMGTKAPGEPGQRLQGTGSCFGRRRRRRKAPDCQAAVQLVETAPIVGCITKHSLPGSGDRQLHPSPAVGNHTCRGALDGEIEGFACCSAVPTVPTVPILPGVQRHRGGFVTSSSSGRVQSQFYPQAQPAWQGQSVTEAPPPVPC